MKYFSSKGLRMRLPQTPAWPRTRIGTPLRLQQQTIHATASTAEASQTTTAAAREVFHAGGATAQGSQSTTAAGRLVFHAGGATAQATQAASSAGRLVFHAGGATSQASQAAVGSARLVYHAGGLTQEGSQSTFAAGRSGRDIVATPTPTPTPEPTPAPSLLYDGFRPPTWRVARRRSTIRGGGMCTQARQITQGRGHLAARAPTDDELAAIFGLAA
jgi:hypothetical protein